MSGKDLLEAILKESGLPVKYYAYEGTNDQYIVYNEEAEQPVNYGNNRPLNTVTWWQVHIFSPKSGDFRTIKENIKRSLQRENFVVTDITTLYEEETETIHVILSCHMGEREV